MRKLICFISCLALFASFTACNNKTIEPISSITVDAKSLINDFKLGETFSMNMEMEKFNMNVSRLNDDESYVKFNINLDNDVATALFIKQDNKIYLCSECENNPEGNGYFVSYGEDTETNSIATDLIGFDANNMKLEYVDTKDDTYTIKVHISDNTEEEIYDGNAIIKDNKITEFNFSDDGYSCIVYPDYYEPIKIPEHNYVVSSIEDMTDSLGMFVFMGAISTTESVPEETTTIIKTEPITESVTEIPTPNYSKEDVFAKTKIEVMWFNNEGIVTADTYEDVNGNRERVTYQFVNPEDAERFLAMFDVTDVKGSVYMDINIAKYTDNYYFVDSIIDLYYD